MLTADKFKRVGYTKEEAERIDRPTISYWQDAWRRLKKNPVAMASLVVLGLILIMVIVGPYIRGYDFVSKNVKEKNQGMSAKYWFGTDYLGRDLFSRVWMGARASIIIALVATALKLIVGTLYGAAMAHFGGWIDDVMMRIIEVINSLPSLLITILIMMVLGNNLFALLVALSITAWCSTARQVRGMIKQLKESEYVYAAEVLGAKPSRIILKHYVPNMLGILILNMSTSIPAFIFTEAGLSFLGIGLTAPEISLGVLISQGQQTMSDQKNDKILEVKNLKVSYHTYAGEVKSVRGVSFDLKEGEAIAIVGESGCGKSVTAKSIMGLIKGPQGEIKQGSEILYHGDNILNYNKKQWQAYKGGEVAIIFQDALASLNPTMRVGKQIMENLMAHKHMTKDEAKKEAVRMLQKVGIPEPEKRVRQYPHEFSGGMRQRVMIAIAFACDPKILICDEPTTALDVTIQGQILDIIKELQREHNTSVIMITHDLGVVANIAQKIAVMYSGVIVERGNCEDIFYRPRHPYTWALIRSVPRLDLENKQVLASIPGTPPDLLNPPVGCPFCTRCEYCMEICKEQMPEVTEFGDGHEASCWLHHPLAPKVEMPGEA